MTQLSPQSVQHRKKSKNRVRSTDFVLKPLNGYETVLMLVSGKFVELGFGKISPQVIRRPMHPWDLQGGT